jgi:transposase
VQRWVKAYRQQGTEGLIAKPRTGAKPKLNEAVKRRIVGMKKKHPEYGPRRIADVLKNTHLKKALKKMLLNWPCGAGQWIRFTWWAAWAVSRW